jgi:cytoskeletal protein CcmA (bactofilin family)
MDYKEVFKKNAPDSSFTLSKNMIINGDIQGDVSGRIEGHIFGNVFVSGKVVVAETGIIEGDISASDVVVLGLVKGNIIASNALNVEPLGKVMGSVTSLSIFVDSQATIKGTIHKITSRSEIELLISKKLNKIASSTLNKDFSTTVASSNSFQPTKPLPLNLLDQDSTENNQIELDINSAPKTNKENNIFSTLESENVQLEEIEEKKEVIIPPKAPDRWW